MAADHSNETYDSYDQHLSEWKLADKELKERGVVIQAEHKRAQARVEELDAATRIPRDGTITAKVDPAEVEEARATRTKAAHAAKAAAAEFKEHSARYDVLKQLHEALTSRHGYNYDHWVKTVKDKSGDDFIPSQATT